MSVLARAWRRGLEARSSVTPGLPLKDAALAAFMGGTNTASGRNVTANTAESIVTVYACVNSIAQGVAALPWQLYRRLKDDARERARDHPLYRVLHDRPNEQQTAFEFRELMVGVLALRGNACAEIFRNSMGQVTALVPLHPDKVMPFQTPAMSRPAYRVLDASGGQRILLADEVFHLRLRSDDGLLGKSPVSLARELLGNAMVMQEHQGRLFANGARLSGILKTDKVIGDDGLDRLKKEFATKFQGERNAYKVAILEHGLSWEQVGLSSSDLQMLEQLKLSDLMICRLFGVKPHKVGILDRATFTNIEEQSLEHETDTLAPYAIRLDQRANLQLIPEHQQNDFYAEHMFEALRMTRMGEETTRSIQQVSWGLISVNEWRKRRNLPPVPGGDQHLAPLNMQVLSMLGLKLPGMTPSDEPAPQPNEADDE